jgi:outer membrane protein OmpA-like peptidoglycan-associated protein
MTRWRTLAAAFASLALACGAMAPATAPSFAQQGLTEEELLNALRPVPKRGGTSTEPLPGSVEEQRFIDRTRTDRTRQLTLDTPNASRIADDRPSIALGITFQYNSAELSFATTQQLTQLGRALASPALKGGVFLIAGHTDAKGSDLYTLELSQRRADAVKRFLMENFGIPDENLVTVGYGKRQLKNTADPFAAENRRIEIVNLSGGGCRRGPSSAPFC